MRPGFPRGREKRRPWRARSSIKSVFICGHPWLNTPFFAPRASRITETYPPIQKSIHPKCFEHLPMRARERQQAHLPRRLPASTRLSPLLPILCRRGFHGAGLEHFHQICSDELRTGKPRSFWLLAAFRLSYRVRLNLRLRRRPMIGTTRQKPKILAAHRYIFSVNALIAVPGKERWRAT